MRADYKVIDQMDVDQREGVTQHLREMPVARAGLHRARGVIMRHYQPHQPETPTG